MPLEVHGVKELAARLGGIETEMQLELAPAVLEAGNVVADQARSNFGWSSVIPGTISVSARWSARGGGAQVRVPERGYPHAGEVRTLEGDGESPSEFFHRAYGNPRVYVPMMTRPALGPAAEQKAEEAEGIIAAAVGRVFSFI